MSKKAIGFNLDEDYINRFRLLCKADGRTQAGMMIKWIKMEEEAIKSVRRRVFNGSQV